MLKFRDLIMSFRKLNLGHAPIIAHASLSAFGNIQGGADTLLGALLAVFPSLIMPTFTYKTMITPKTGPPNNGINYGSGSEFNQVAEFFRLDMPADIMMGIVPETLRKHPESKRSTHPIYSFAGVNADAALKAQTLDNPFGPIQWLTESGGWVLLLGVDHTSNTSIHYGEQVAGRKQFIRWALTPQGIIQCPRWPGCSYGFHQITSRLTEVAKMIEIGPAQVQAILLKDLVKIVTDMIAESPSALLCSDLGCEQCNTIRNQSAAG